MCDFVGGCTNDEPNGTYIHLHLELVANNNEQQKDNNNNQPWHQGPKLKLYEKEKCHALVLYAMIMSICHLGQRWICGVKFHGMKFT